MIIIINIIIGHHVLESLKGTDWDHEGLYLPDSSYLYCKHHNNNNKYINNNNNIIIIIIIILI